MPITEVPQGLIRPPVVLSLGRSLPVDDLVVPCLAGMLVSLRGECCGLVERQLRHLEVCLVSDRSGLSGMSDLQVLGQGKVGTSVCCLPADWSVLRPDEGPLRVGGPDEVLRRLSGHVTDVTDWF